MSILTVRQETGGVGGGVVGVTGAGVGGTVGGTVGDTVGGTVGDTVGVTVGGEVGEASQSEMVSVLPKSPPVPFSISSTQTV